MVALKTIGESVKRFLRWFFLARPQRKIPATTSKNPKLQALLKEYEALQGLTFDNTESEGLLDQITNLMLCDSYIAGYISTYVHYGKYPPGHEMADVDPREGLRDEIQGLKKTLSKFKKYKPVPPDEASWKGALKWMKDAIRIGEAVLQEER